MRDMKIAVVKYVMKNRNNGKRQRLGQFCIIDTFHKIVPIFGWLILK